MGKHVQQISKTQKDLINYFYNIGEYDLPILGKLDKYTFNEGAGTKSFILRQLGNEKFRRKRELYGKFYSDELIKPKDLYKKFGNNPNLGDEIEDLVDKNILRIVSLTKDEYVLTRKGVKTLKKLREEAPSELEKIAAASIILIGFIFVFSQKSFLSGMAIISFTNLDNLLGIGWVIIIIGLLFLFKINIKK